MVDTLGCAGGKTARSQGGLGAVNSLHDYVCDSLVLKSAMYPRHWYRGMSGNTYHGVSFGEVDSATSLKSRFLEIGTVRPTLR